MSWWDRKKHATIQPYTDSEQHFYVLEHEHNLQFGWGKNFPGEDTALFVRVSNQEWCEVKAIHPDYRHLVPRDGRVRLGQFCRLVYEMYGERGEACVRRYLDFLDWPQPESEAIETSSLDAVIGR
jgi:hypothetical protein